MARLPGAAAGAHRRCQRRQRPVPALASAHNSSARASSVPSSRADALQCSLQLAAMRAAEQQQELPLFADAFSAPALAAARQAGGGPPAAAAAAVEAGAAAAGPEARREALATRFLDEQLLKAVTIVNMERDLAQARQNVFLC